MGANMRPKETGRMKRRKMSVQKEKEREKRRKKMERGNIKKEKKACKRRKKKKKKEKKKEWERHKNEKRGANDPPLSISECKFVGCPLVIRAKVNVKIALTIGVFAEQSPFVNSNHVALDGRVSYFFLEYSIAILIMRGYRHIQSLVIGFWKRVNLKVTDCSNHVIGYVKVFPLLGVDTPHPIDGIECGATARII